MALAPASLGTAGCTGEGCLLWTATVDEPTGDRFFDLGLTGERVVATGIHDRGGEEDVLTVAFSRDTGGQQWTGTYDGPADGRDQGTAVAPSLDGKTAYVTGISDGDPDARFPRDYVTIAYDVQTGETEWIQRHDDQGYWDTARDVATGPEGERVFVTGYSLGEHQGTRSGDFLTLAYEAETGNLLWAARYDGGHDAGTTSNNDYALSVGVGPEGSRVYVAGASYTGDHGTDSYQNDYAVVAYNASTGEERWTHRYDEVGGFDRGARLALAPDGSRLFVAGWSEDGENYDLATVALDPESGDRAWVARYDGPAGGDERFFDGIDVTPDGSLVAITGQTPGEEGTQAVTVAYRTATGERAWAARYDGPGEGDDRGRGLVADARSERVLVAVETDADGNPGWATLAYSAATGELLWAQTRGAPDETDLPRAIATDAWDAYVAGRDGDAPADASLAAYAIATEPTAPQDPSAEAGPRAGEITVTWEPPRLDGGEPIANYTVHRGTNGSTLSPVATVAGDQTRFTDRGLPDGTSFRYTITAGNEVGEGPPSADVSATTFERPSQPRGVQAAAGPPTVPGTVEVTWDVPAEQGGSAVTLYRVYRALDGRNATLAAEVDAPRTSYIDEGLVPAAPYRYHVTAVNLVGEGPASGEACTLASPAPDLDFVERALCQPPGPSR